MIQITIAEAKIVRAKYPKACIAKTRHKRYLEESMRYLELIPNNFEASQIIERERFYAAKKMKNNKKANNGGMAQAKKAVTFKNAIIDTKDGTITEFTKDETNVYNLQDVLAEWDGVEGISITIQNTSEIPPVEE